MAAARCGGLSAGSGVWGGSSRGGASLRYRVVAVGFRGDRGDRGDRAGVRRRVTFHQVSRGPVAGAGPGGAR